ncbi:MAG: class I lanthipeptide [Candidatus Aminicenantes bacterium]|nr:MAG: class I lanthipeptide [Candidatus Aminicenantes bacterium]
MKQKQMTKKLTFNKETVSNLELDKALGGKFTMDYSQCGTGYATLVPCLCGGDETFFC